MEFLGYPLEVERRVYQRSINVKVHVNGSIKVTAGKSIADRKIFHFLNESRDWISKAQLDHEKVRLKYPPKKFVEGEFFLYLGIELPLRILPRQQRKLNFEIDANELKLIHPHSYKTSQKELRTALRKCYEKVGRKWLEHRTHFWSQKMQLSPKNLSFRSQKTRWGSCSSKGDISLNWRLVAAPLPVIDYVVSHELSHLRHQDHSKDFWQLVETFDPNYIYNRKWLRTHQWEFDFLAKTSELHDPLPAQKKA